MPVLGQTILSNRKPNQRRRWRKSLLKSEFTLFQRSLLLFHAIQFVKCSRSFLELNSKGLYLRLRKRIKKIVFSCLRRCRVTAAKKCTKKREERAKFSFVNLNLLLSCPFQCVAFFLSSGKTSKCKNL